MLVLVNLLTMYAWLCLYLAYAYTMHMLTAHLLRGEECLDLLALYSHPVRAADRTSRLREHRKVLRPTPTTDRPPSAVEEVKLDASCFPDDQELYRVRARVRVRVRVMVTVRVRVMMRAEPSKPKP